MKTLEKGRFMVMIFLLLFLFMTIVAIGTGF